MTYCIKGFDYNTVTSINNTNKTVRTVKCTTKKTTEMQLHYSTLPKVDEQYIHLMPREDNTHNTSIGKYLNPTSKALLHITPCKIKTVYASISHLENTLRQTAPKKLLYKGATSSNKRQYKGHNDKPDDMIQLHS